MNKIKKNISLSKYTTFKVGGPADYFIDIEDEDEFKESIIWAISKDIPYFILGRGANVLVSDRGYRGLVIYTGKFDKIRKDDSEISAQCGVLIDTLVDYTMENSLTGLEFLAGMPGTVGGAVYMNARAYGGEISNVINEAEVLIVDKERIHIRKQVLSRDSMGFSYKRSIFQKGDIFLIEARFVLHRANQKDVMRRIQEIRRKRKEKGEYLFPSAGCIFKNNYSVGRSSGKIIDECGLKGLSIGGAEVYKKHANFIINKGSATADDIHKLIKMVEKEVKDKTGIELEREIVLVGFDEEI